MVSRITTALRYPGGKSKALKMILPRIYEDYKHNYGPIKEYREPFVGGGSVFISVKQDLGDDVRYRINDLNTNLYCFWKLAKERPELLVNEVLKLKNKFPDGRSLYQSLDKYSHPGTELERAVKFFIRNRITFSGNTDSGGYSQQAYDRRFTLSSINRIQTLNTLLKDVYVTNDNYSKLLFKPGKDVFIYLDPPYYTAMKSELYGRNGDLHKTFNHKKFANTLKWCQFAWLMTYDDCQEIRELFDFAHIYEWQLQYGVNNGKSKSKIGNELFISSYEIPSLKKVNSLDINLNKINCNVQN